MSYTYILSIFLLIGSGAGLATTTSSKAVNAALDKGVIVPAQDTVQQASAKSEKKKKKSSKKKTEDKSTRVTMKREVQGASLSRRSEEGSHVEIVVMNSGMAIRNLEDLQLIGSSGTTVSSNNFLGFDNVTLPFEGNIRFKAANKLGTAVYDREVRFVVNDPGRWVLRINL